jgi:hypothetical protein
MDENLVYLSELEFLIESINLAVDDLNDSLSLKTEEAYIRAWYSIQGILINIGNISKILYPSSHSSRLAKSRGERLRRLLGMPDESILSEKKMRNCFEHYDEKLDAFEQKRKREGGVYISRSIGTSNAIHVDGGIRNFLMRQYNIETKTLIYRDIQYDIQEAIDEVGTLQLKLEALGY